MTAADATVHDRGPGRVPGPPAQWVAMTRLLLKDAMTYLVSATLVMGAFLLLGLLVARWRGWELVTSTDLDTIGAAVSADSDGVTVLASVSLLAVAAGIAAIVVPVVQAARTRVYVAAGATRRSVATGHLVTLAAMAVYVLLVLSVVLVAAGGLDDGVAMLTSRIPGAPAGALVEFGGLVVLGMAVGSVATVTFLRWPWWVGVGALVLVFTLLPLLTLAVPALAQLASAVAGWPWSDLAIGLALLVLYWVVVSRVPVR